MPVKKLVSKTESDRERQQKCRDRQREVKTAILSEIPPHPPQLDDECQAIWYKTAQNLMREGLLTAPRVEYLVQFSLLKARRLREGVDCPATVHGALRAVTRELWRKSPDDGKPQHVNPFAEL